MKRPLVARREKARIDESFQVVAERRSGKINVRLDVSSRRAIRVTLHHKAQDLKAQRMTQRTELLRMMFQFRTHEATSNFFEVGCQGEISGTVRSPPITRQALFVVGALGLLSHRARDGPRRV